MSGVGQTPFARPTLARYRRGINPHSNVVGCGPCSHSADQIAAGCCMPVAGYARMTLVRPMLSNAFSQAHCGDGEFPLVTHRVLAGYLLAMVPAATGTRP